MATARFIGEDEVIKKYRELESPYFSMWCKTQLICQYNGDDIDEGAEMIADEIKRNVKHGFGAELYLKVHSDQEKNYTIKSPVIYNIVFKSFDDGFSGASVANGNMNFAVLQNLQSINSRLSALESQKNEDDADGEDDEADDNDDPVNNTIGQIEKLIASPVISALIDKLFSPSPKPVSKLSGVGSEFNNNDPALINERLNRALSILFKNGLTIEHIEQLAKMPAVKLKQLLTLI